MADPKQILVVGDVHGNAHWTHNLIAHTPELLPDEHPRLILQLGDFGFLPRDIGTIRKLDRVLEQADAVLWFIDGNHDQHHQLADLPRTPGGFGWVGDRVFHIPRGHRWVWHGRTWLGLGGAVSLDRAGSHRIKGKTWWPEEEITPGQAAAVTGAGHADVLITHDCPASVVHTFPAPPTWWDLADLARSDRHRERLQSVVDGVEPTHLMHGHLHRAYARTVRMSHGDVEVTGFDCDRSARGNWRVLDVQTMEWGISHA